MGGSYKGGSSEELYAYPVESWDVKHKVVELGGEKLYHYVGEISIPADMEVVEGTLPYDILPTEYPYQTIYEGALHPEFFTEQYDNYVNLHIGNDKHGYTSLKIEPSEDPNNLKWFKALGLGMFQESPGDISFAYNTKDWTLHYIASSIFPCNMKIYWLYKAQKLDINLIPQEIARKEDVKEEIENYEYPVVTVDADTKTYSGELGSKYINIDINILTIHYGNEYGYGKTLQLIRESYNSYWYGNNNILILFDGDNNNVVTVTLNNPVFSYNDTDYDYKSCDFTEGTCRVYYLSNFYPATLDANDYVTTLIGGKYIKYKLNRETHLLELQSEIDLNSIEARLAALEAK